MKKFLKIICGCLVTVFCLCASFGCSCSKPLNMKLSVTYSNGTEEGAPLYNIYSTIKVYTKFREPADTACYQKIEDELVLIEDATGVSSCYDAGGNKFEKATYKNTDKQLLQTTVYKSTEKVNEQNIMVHESNLKEFPENSNYGFRFEIVIENLEKFPLYFKEVDVQSLLGGALKEESIEKIQLKDTYTDVTINGENYYTIKKHKYILDDVFDKLDNTVTIIIEVKNLTNKDLNEKLDNLTMNLNINLIKFEE